MKRVFCCLLALGLMLSIGQTAWALSYQIQDLDLLPGQTSSVVNGMNDRHEVVGKAYSSGNAGNGFYWSEQTGAIDLGAGEARGINNHGEVVGWSATQNKSYVWSRQSGFTYAATGLQYYKINDAGQIAAIGANYAGLLIALNGTVTGIDPGYIIISISGLNQQGRVCGYEYPVGPFIWSVATNYIGLSSLPGQARYPGDTRRWVAGLNDSGIAVGQSLNADDDGRAVRWSATGGRATALALLPGAVESAAWDINNAGVIVGMSTIQDSTACVWYADGAVQNLGYLAGCSWSEAAFVSTDGYIVGRSYDGSTYHAVLWTPVPEPSSILALLTGIAGIAGAVIKRRR